MMTKSIVPIPTDYDHARDAPLMAAARQKESGRQYGKSSRVLPLHSLTNDVKRFNALLPGNPISGGTPES